MTNEQQNSNEERWSKEHSQFNPVNVNVEDTVGVFILGMLAFVLLLALLRSEARNRKLIAKLSQDSRG